jgi:HTH-type transcriptional regulator / antitoxin HigA
MRNEKIFSDLPIPPGEYLAEVLEEKGFSQKELAYRMGRPAQAICEIIKGEKAITPETALQLERTLGVPSYIWTSLEDDYRIIKARQAENAALEKEIPLLKDVPYSNLAGRGYLKKTPDKRHQVRECQAFYGVASLANLDRVNAYGAAFRHSKARRVSSLALAAWIRCAEIEAAKHETPPFQKAMLKVRLEVIRRLTLVPLEDSIGQLQVALFEAGINFILLPHFAKTYAHGAVLWPDPKHPVLVLSIRGKWADLFWFSLIHELGHILLHGNKEIIDEEGREADEKELEADRFALDRLIPAVPYERFLAREKFDTTAISFFAAEIGIHPGILIGRLQHDRKLPFKTLLNEMRPRLDWEKLFPRKRYVSSA